MHLCSNYVVTDKHTHILTHSLAIVSDDGCADIDLEPNPLYDSCNPIEMKNNELYELSKPIKFQQNCAYNHVVLQS